MNIQESLKQVDFILEHVELHIRLYRPSTGSYLDLYWSRPLNCVYMCLPENIYPGWIVHSVGIAIIGLYYDA